MRFVCAGPILLICLLPIGCSPSDEGDTERSDRAVAPEDLYEAPRQAASSDRSEETAPNDEAPRSGEEPGEPDRRARPPALEPPLRRAAGLIAERRLETARDVIEAFLSEHPEHGPATFLLGLTHHEAFNYGKAKPLFERAIELEPEYHPVYHFYGWCLYHLGEADAAREAMLQHLEFSPGEGDSHYVIGLIHLDAGRVDEAEQRFRKAVEYQEGVRGRQGSLANAHAGLGRVHALREQWEQAREHLETAVTLFPPHDEAWYQLYRVMLRLGEDEKAALALERHEEVSRHADRATGFPE